MQNHQLSHAQYQKLFFFLSQICSLHTESRPDAHTITCSFTHKPFYPCRGLVIALVDIYCFHKTVLPSQLLSLPYDCRAISRDSQRPEKQLSHSSVLDLGACSHFSHHTHSNQASHEDRGQAGVTQVSYWWCCGAAWCSLTQ